MSDFVFDNTKVRGGYGTSGNVGGVSGHTYGISSANITISDRTTVQQGGIYHGGYPTPQLNPYQQIAVEPKPYYTTTWVSTDVLKEYQSIMGNKNMDYDHPIQECERDCMKIMQYELIGLDESMIEEKVEFVNKSKETYLTLKGTYEDEYTDFTNEINIRMKIDTDMYNGYKWFIKNGILTLVLFERLNPQPAFVKRLEKSADEEREAIKKVKTSTVK